MGRVYTKSGNFLSVQRCEKGLTIKNISEILGCSPSTAAAYFSGFMLPTKDVAHKICDLLDVKYAKGTREFNKIFDLWGEEHPQYMKVGRTYKYISDYEEPEESPELPEEEIEYEFPEVEPHPAKIPVKTELSSSILEFLYGKVEYATFKMIRDGGKIPRYIVDQCYGLADYATFKDLEKYAEPE